EAWLCRGRPRSEQGQPGAGANRGRRGRVLAPLGNRCRPAGDGGRLVAPRVARGDRPPDPGASGRRQGTGVSLRVKPGVLFGGTGMTAALALMAKAPLPGVWKTRRGRRAGGGRAGGLFGPRILRTVAV